MKTPYNMMKILFAIASISACAHTPQTTGDFELDQQIRSFVSPFAANSDFSGIVAVARSGVLIGEEAFGTIGLASDNPATLDTSFHIASLSKTFTAAAIHELIRRGELTLDDPLSKFIPEFPNGDKITIRHLLGHQSGVPDYWSLPDIDEISSAKISLQDLVGWLARQPLEFPPGSRSSYSNSGYALLAAVIEKASGQSYQEFLESQIFPQAGLIATSAYKREADAEGLQPWFGPSRLAPPTPYDPSILIGSGSLKSTARDLLRWCAKFNSDFSNPAQKPFLYGWGPREANGRRWVEQTGRDPGYASQLRAYPEADLCIVVLSNIESDAVDAIGAGLADIAFGESPTAPAIRPTYSLAEERYNDYVGRFEIGPGNFIEIKRLPEGLALRGQNGAFLPLEPIGEDRFFYRQLYVEIAAHRDEEGRVDVLLWGGTYRMPRADETPK